jgi:hypothetical protein
MPAPYTQFKLNDNAANTTVDDVGTGDNDGISSTNTSNLTAIGKINQAFDFVAASSEYVSVDALEADIGADTKGTISVWVYINDNTVGQYIFSLANSTGVALTALFYSASTGFRASNLDSGGTINWRVTSSSISSATWYHVVLTQDGVKPVLYVNGVENGTFDTTADTTKWFSSNASDNGRIGCLNFNSGGNTLFMDGKIDDFRYYQNTALNATQIGYLYAAGVGTEDYYGEGDLTVPTAVLTQNTITVPTAEYSATPTAFPKSQVILIA